MSIDLFQHRQRRALRVACVRVAVGLLAAAGLAPGSARATDVSAPVIMQWFESSWQTMSKRVPDHFNAGYGAIWTPPPGRALYDDQGGGIGYNLYDRFDLGKAGDTTLYGTEKGYRKLVNQMHTASGDVYIDYVHHHVGSWDVPGYTGWGGFTPNKSIQDRSDYPGFELSDPYVGANSFNPNYRNLAGQRDSYPDAPPVNDGNTTQYQYQYRLAHLITIDLTSTRSFTRNPVPGDPNNIRQAANPWAIGTSTTLPNGKPGASTIVRQANTPTEDNRRFYPDQNLPGVTVTDPLNGGSYTIHPYNKANPSAGDPVSETNAGYMMRYAQWLVNDIGVDGLRIDAARHVPYGQGNDPYNPNNLNMPALVDRAVFNQSTRRNLDGSNRSVFSFQEVFSGDKSLLQNFTRKPNPNAAPNEVTGNRDVLDFPMWFAMRGNMTTDGTRNNWYNLRNASQDINDDGLANNGSQSIGFVINHDDGKGNAGAQNSDYIALDNVAHAWILMRPGNAYVYYNAHEFDRTGNNEFFLKDGRGDALGGQYGNIITNLVDIRNSYGRGDFKERFIDPGSNSAIYVFERENSAVVGLNIGYNPGTAQRTVDTAFAPGTHLEEVTGNWQDASGQVARTVTVGGDKKVTINIPWNNGQNLNKGYVIYGLPRPRGNMSLSNVSQTLAPETQNASTNGSARISAIDVVTANSFNISLNTNAVTLSDGYRDKSADGDRAYVRMDGGLDLNNSGTVDFRTNGDTRYGFESFTTTNSNGYTATNGNGQYVQSIDATKLSEGYHYITTRAYRQRSDGGPDVFSEFKRAVYVDRLKPVSALDSATVTGTNARDIQVKSTDGTAEKVYTFMNLPANLTDAQIIATIGSGNQATQTDVDQFAKNYTNVLNGNNVVTVVTREITGNTNVQRFSGVNLLSTIGAGLGDNNFDGQYSAGDVTGTSYGTEALVYPTNGTMTSSPITNTQFNPAADVNGDGVLDSNDLYAQRNRFEAIGAPAAATNAARTAVLTRGDVNADGITNSRDITFLMRQRGNTAWKYDLNGSAWWKPGMGSDFKDVDTLVRVILRSQYGDTDLSGKIDGTDYGNVDSGFLLANGDGGGGAFPDGEAKWSDGDFNGDGNINGIDYALIDYYYLLENESGSIDGSMAGVGSRIARAVKYLELGDPSGDPSMVNDQYLINVHEHFGQFGEPYASAFLSQVPEPTSVLLISICSIAALRRRRAV